MSSGELPPPASINTDALARFQHECAERLKLAASGQAPKEAGAPAGQNVPPSGIQRLDDSAGRLETLLLTQARVRADAAAEVAAIEKLTGADLTAQGLDQVALRPGHWQSDKAAAAIARLKLLKIMDAMLENCVATECRELNAQWQALGTGQPPPYKYSQLDR